jgi:hypothetical protein
MMITPIMAVRSIKLPVGPNTHAWLKRVRARPGWQRALARMKQEEKAFDNKGKL